MEHLMKFCMKPFIVNQFSVYPMTFTFGGIEMSNQGYWVFMGLRIIDPWRPFWMTENHFLWHFSPFQINAQLLFV